MNNSKLITEKAEDCLYQTLREFKAYVSFKSHITDFDSFQNNKFINDYENYKKEIWQDASSIKEKLRKTTDFGSGNLLRLLIQSIELKDNNLVEWHGKNGPNSKEHLKLIELQNESYDRIFKFEKNTWEFYFSNSIKDEDYFNYFITNINRRYSVIAYLFFIKDRKNYLPIAPETFDLFFKEHNISLTTKMHCSWENYYEYISVFQYIKSFLRENLDDDACLIDAHSFAWIMEREYKYDLEKGYYNVPSQIKVTEKNRTVVTKARIGQGLYREQLLKKWNYKSSVGEYSNTTFLIASHIKPWTNSNNEECVDPENGLLLIPNLDTVFDKGFITFKNDGAIIISKYLSEDDKRELNIHPGIKIKQVSDKMKFYLDYHRNHIFEKNYKSLKK